MAAVNAALLTSTPHHLISFSLSHLGTFSPWHLFSSRSRSPQVLARRDSTPVPQGVTHQAEPVRELTEYLGLPRLVEV
jgi:hypothetical protein